MKAVKLNNFTLFKKNDYSGIAAATSTTNININNNTTNNNYDSNSCKLDVCVRASYMKLTRDTHLMQQFIYYYKQLYMFRASICPSSGILGCIRIILLHMVSSTRCCGWGSEEPVCSIVHWCKLYIRHNLHQWTRLHSGSSEPQPQHLVLDTIWSSIIRIQANIPEDGHIDARNMQSCL